MPAGNLIGTPQKGLLSELAIGDYATTPSGRLVKLVRPAAKGRFECSYVGSDGDQVVLRAGLLLKRDALEIVEVQGPY